jgi:hypothetical protein
MTREEAIQLNEAALHTTPTPAFRRCQRCSGGGRVVCIGCLTPFVAVTAPTPFVLPLISEVVPTPISLALLEEQEARDRAEDTVKVAQVLGDEVRTDWYVVLAGAAFVEPMAAVRPVRVTLAPTEDALQAQVDRFERLVIEQTLEACRGNRQRTADTLQISLRTLCYKLRRIKYAPVSARHKGKAGEAA